MSPEHFQHIPREPLPRESSRCPEFSDYLRWGIADVEDTAWLVRFPGLGWGHDAMIAKA